jgi:hypothetical protein
VGVLPGVLLWRWRFAVRSPVRLGRVITARSVRAVWWSVLVEMVGRCGGGKGKEVVVKGN